MVLLGGGAHRLERRVLPLFTPVLAIGLALFGFVVLLQGIRG